MSGEDWQALVPFGGAGPTKLSSSFHNHGGLAPPAGRGSLFRFGCYSWGGVSALWLGHLRLPIGLGFWPAVPVHLEVPVFTQTSGPHSQLSGSSVHSDSH